MAGQMQAQAEAQRVNAKQREEAQRAETKQLVEAQRAEAKQREEAQPIETKQREESIRSKNLAREELLIRMKTDADKTNAARERVIAENDLKSRSCLWTLMLLFKGTKCRLIFRRTLIFSSPNKRKEIEQ